MTDLDGPGRIQPRQHGRRMIGHEVATDFRAAGANLAGAVEHVLVRQRHAVQRPERAPGFDGGIGLAGMLARARAGNADEAIENGLQPFDAVEARLNQSLGMKLPLRNGGGRLPQGKRCGILHACAPASSCSSRRV